MKNMKNNIKQARKNMTEENLLGKINKNLEL
jgi:hypothetical protein